ncbi:MBL fold metallo-hydrolase [Paenibacillus gansuensis]|uniref:MBL fold metallo-hydrolase n=1 Tax=Paenibacillus gansuensis TaxID=306542 RepID=A0ABW5PBI4_9BACL
MSTFYKHVKTGTELIDQINRTEVPSDGMAMWHLGQESMVFKRGGLIVYIDPYLSNSIDEMYGGAPRSFPTPVEPNQVTNADYVFITHEHADHLDPVSIKGIAEGSPGARFVVPAPFKQNLTDLGISPERMILAYAAEPIKAEGLEVTPVACMHEQFEQDEKGHHKFLGYVFDWDGLVLYHAGDTVIFPELIEQLKPLRIEVACLPINGHDFRRNNQNLAGNMTFREAADLTEEIGADLVVPMHYDLFAFNTDNPAYFVDYLHRAYPDQPFKMFVPGERMLHLSSRL